MSFLIWLIGLLTGGLFIYFWPVLKKLTWYWWAVLVIWYLIGVFAAAFSSACFSEEATRAGWMGILFFGGIFVVLGVIVYIFGIRKDLEKKKDIRPTIGA